MTSLRNHRVVIASLFLPTTAVLGESGPPTPERVPSHSESLSIPAINLRLVDGQKTGRPPVTRHHSSIGVGSSVGPLKSIVEDLRDKTRNATPALRSPTQEAANPFAKLNRLADQAVDEASKALESQPIPTIALSLPPLSRKHQTTHTDHQHITRRVSRKNSRSSSRRADAETTRNIGGLLSESWHFEPNPHCNGGLKNAIDSVHDRLKKKIWVGALGENTDSFNDSVRRIIDKRMLIQQSSLPVWIPDAEFSSCYDEFCHQVLWPCLHYAVPDAPRTKLFYESASYKQYVAVNRKFADAIIANFQEGDVIWVNDYHLMLVPQMLRSSPKIPSSTPIGFFMHVAFPSSEIFRCLTVRVDLLRGMLGADLVAFQTPNFARHFRQTVSRILAYEALPKGIQIADEDTAGPGKLRELGAGGRGRFVDVAAIPMGIDVGQMKQKLQEPDVAEWVQVLKQRYSGMKLLVGRDKLDEVQGVRQKIQAFETFLERNPQWHQKVVLIQVALQTTESNELAGGAADVVARVNSRYATLTYQPIIFLHTQDLTFSQYLALLTVADAFVVTSLREGMALRTHEFVECQSERFRPLILSEFTGSYSYSGFRSCISVNPWDAKGTANAINQALTMTEDEAKGRWEDLHNHVITQNAPAFVTSFLSRTLRANVEHIQGDLADVPVLDTARIVPRYKHSQKRLILVDFEGTIWKRDLSKPLQQDATSLPTETLDTLKKLSEDKKNELWLLSGLPIKGVLEKIAEYVPKMGIVAENGCFIKTRATRTQPTGEWISMVSNLNLKWKASCVEILNYFSERTPGAFVEDRGASVVWRFWTGAKVDSPDRQWARRQAAEAQNHIYDSLGERFGIRLIPGSNHFLVLPNNISRSTAVGAILYPGGPASSPLISRAASGAGWGSTNGGRRGSGFIDDDEVHAGGTDLDFILAMTGDEKLVRRLNDFDNAETCSTSSKGTDALWKLEAAQASGTLALLAGITSATNGN
ncbi:alpha,alpha-trehalose-phosphate synthase [Pluteus cervinus]|uniref:Alpha,alpha-trehalose-phosphate synthase n=1 Tax=Pluteus cervinus TaxID=181527 RepID=A0ACD3ALS8_9AGAR|nr:alpha,alpha-trehalose-phosphate synthase [Pluteus cervinus]